MSSANEAGDARIRAQFWQSVEQRAMGLPRCNGCQRFFFYPRAVCPYCWSDAVALEPVSGSGRIWSYTIVRFAHGSASPWHQRLPYALALVELDEGVRIMANILECAAESVYSGLRVQLMYAHLDGRTLYAFKPA